MKVCRNGSGEFLVCRESVERLQRSLLRLLLLLLQLLLRLLLLRERRELLLL